MLDLKTLAFDKGIGQKEMGEIIGVAQSQVSAMINGKRVIRLEHIAKLYEKFGKECVDSYMINETPAVPYQAIATIYSHNQEEKLREIARKEEGIEEATAEEVEIKETIILGADAINKVGVDLRKELKKSPEDMVLDVEVKPTQDVLPPHEVKIYTENDEMASDIEPNDPVFAHLIPSPKLFKPRHMYLVNLEYGSVVRWVVPEGEDHIRLVSRKGSDVVPISSVKAMFEVVAITKRPKTLPIDLTTESQRMERKESQLNTMLEQQGRLIGIIEGQIKHE
jgi:transcriptional regulator with XRE-family HTH domain